MDLYHILLYIVALVNSFLMYMKLMSTKSIFLFKIYIC